MWIAPKSKLGLYVIFSVRLCAQHKNIKMSLDRPFFLCAYTFPSAKIHLSQKVLFYLSKSCFCAQHINAWKWHLIKKIRTTSFFLCAIAFSSAKIQLSQKVLFYLSKSCFCAQRINAWKWHLIKKSGPHLFSVSLCVFKCKDSSLFITGRLYRSPWFLLTFVFP